MAVTGLLRSAAATRKKVQAQQDALIAFDWENSAQTYEDYQDYTNYLIQQSNKTSDPSQSLSYATKLRTANTSYVGNEIQRQTQSVMEGTSNNTEKYKKLVDFYYQAQDSGNLNLAQNLRSQIDNLSITIQNEKQASQTLARSMASEQVTTIQDYVQTQKDIVKQWGDVYKQFGAEGLNDSLKQYADQQGLPSAPGYFDVIAGIIGQPDENGNYPPDSMLGALQTAAAGLDPVNANKLKLDMNKIISGETKFDLPGVGAVSYSDITDALDAQRAGQNIYDIGQDSNGNNIFIKNKLDNYTWGQDATGQMRLINTYDPRGDFSDTELKNSFVLKRDAKGNLLDNKGEITKDASKAARVSYQSLLGAAGLKVVGTNSDGSLRVIHSTSAGGPLDVTGGGQFNVVVDDSGNLRFVHTDAAGQKHLYQYSIDKEGGLKLDQLTAENTSIFGDVGYYKSHASDVGQNMVKQIIGQQDVDFNPLIPSNIHTLQTPNALARPLNTSDILRQGEITSRLQVAKEAPIPQLATVNPQFQAPPLLQSSQTIDLNRVSLPSNSALKVSNAPPAPRISVSAPAPTPQITTTSVAQPTQRITGVTALPSQPKVKVGNY